MKRIATCLYLLLLMGIFPAFAGPLETAEQQRLSPTPAVSAPRKLKDVLLDVKQVFKVDLLFDEELVNGLVSTVIVQKSGRVENVLDLVLPPVGLRYRKVKAKAYIILSQSADKTANPSAKENGLRETSIRSMSAGLEPTSGLTPTTLTSAPSKIAKLVMGVVTDTESGEGLPGVTVLIKGKSTGAVTDAKGKYSISADDTDVLVFSYVGYLASEEKVGNRTQVNVNLAPDTKSLNEVVVVGYGTQKRQDVTGSISSVSEAEIKKLVLTSADQALQGRAAGVQMTQTSSAPGGNTSVRIRGGNSLSAGNEPLYVIDGFPVYNDNSQYTTGALNNGQPTNVLASINPSDIESIEILKDASATAIYGARGANGVVIITTKRGKSGQSNVSFDAYYGLQQVNKQIPLLNATDFAIVANEYQRNLNRPIPYPDPQSYGQGTDWQKASFRVAPIQNYQIGFNGGDAKTQYAISGNYFRQEGIILGSDLQRGSIRVNLDRHISDKFKIGTSFNASRTTNQQITSDTDVNSNSTQGSVSSLITTPPTSPVYDQNGNYSRFFDANGNFVINPIARLLEVTNQSKTSRILGNFFADYQILNGLSARVSIGADQISIKEDYYLPASIQDVNVDAVARQGFIQSFSWLNENTLTYQRTFAQKHAFTGLLGFTRQAFTRESARAGAQRFVNDILGDNSLGSGALTLPAQSARTDWALESYIGRVNYGFQDRFLVTLTGRIDGSSRFGADNKYSFFPSGSVAWRLSEEKFVKPLTFISDLKLRVSYGRTGNQEIPQYRSLAALGNSNYPVGGVINSGLAPTRISNPNLKWESTDQFDVGIDAAFLSNRIQFTADYYYKKTIDLLLDVAIPNSSGFASALQNVGSTQNKGIEMALNTVNVDRKFKWRTSANITFNRNKVLNLGGDIERPSGQASPSSQIQNSGILRVGEPVGIFYGYVSDGLFQTQDQIKASGQPAALPGDRRYKDINGDGLLNANDRTILGYAQPKFFYGFTNNFSYKNFDLSVFFQGVQGNSILNLNLSSEINNSVPEAKNRWTPTNTNTDVPRTPTNGRVVDKLVEDGSFLRLRNVTFGYNLPKNVSTAAHLRSVRLYVSAQNWLTVTKYTGYDPEVSAFGQDNLSIGVDRGSYPVAKTFTFGLNIGL
ncbi:SusC/RagA family TonB-linked outer membrane protein [Fibrivirga algicola]|uniref:SusC/RagA family TonB-linked outer membrane protein n=1 Tax=Fibrivirga algicola TaxID=2950420 RepID=A0ABX0QD69_9BACT|nr:SusC/RagA family TonB-linked outer membrane protein [Fibrivirga algicola]NID09201.1 SusC/RagA family TonB-linked outer membrane protein [Fibrivirga algicola]